VKIDFQPTAQCEAAALSAFLGRRFPRAEPSFLAETHMAWKYWSVRPDWAGSRSFTARRHGAIVAHAAAKVPVMIATGGSEITQRILPVIGFRPHGELCTFARPVRPLRQALATTPKTWRLPARWLRNAFWHVSSPLSLPRGWAVRPLAPEDVPPELWPQPSAATAVTARDTGFYRYFVDSPSTRHELFGLERSRALVGYCCLAFAPHVARIADLWLPSAKVEDWGAGFRAAAAVAARENDVHEVSAWASTALGKEALRRAGFRLRDRAAVSVFDAGRILEGRTLHAQMLDCDASFFFGDVGSYLT
jgi:hypothetical protein